jgi:hypothetical protein
MKPSLSLLAACAAFLTAQADVVNLSLSPPGTDSAVGLSPANESPAVTNSTGSGNAISGGISVSTTPTNATLTLAVGYGSAAGFTDLTGPATSVGIFGPAPTNSNAGLVVDLAPYTFLASDPAKGGVLFGSVLLSASESSNLLAGLYYINITTASNTNGEIRGQLINGTPEIECPTNATVECTGDPIPLTAHVSDLEGDAMTVVWTINGVAVHTNDVAAGSAASGVDVVLNANLDLGTNTVSVAVSDSTGNESSCSSTIVVQDTVPPEIARASASPRLLWPPNHRMVSIDVDVRATDACCPTTWKIVSVTSNEPVNGRGDGNTQPDWVIRGDHGLSLRAERAGGGSGRIYTVVVEAKDCAGNLSETKTVKVIVPHDMGRWHSSR